MNRIEEYIDKSDLPNNLNVLPDETKHSLLIDVLVKQTFEGRFYTGTKRKEILGNYYREVQDEINKFYTFKNRRNN